MQFNHDVNIINDKNLKLSDIKKEYEEYSKDKVNYKNKELEQVFKNIINIAPKNANYTNYIYHEDIESNKNNNVFI
jgi:hypothetical protein